MGPGEIDCVAGRRELQEKSLILWGWINNPLLGENLIQAAQTVIGGLEAPGGSKHDGRFRQ